MRLVSMEIEDAQSWLPEFRDAAIQNKALLIAFHREQARISTLCQKNVFARMNPPANIHEPAYRDLVCTMEKQLQPHSLVAYHCTRLTKDEISNIRENGLRILTADLVYSRLSRCVESGLLTQQEHDYLRNSQVMQGSLADEHGHRTGMIWFCPNRSQLRDSDGVHRLFRSWGGEALYVGHEKDAAIFPALRRVGSPCIVKCAVPFVDGNHFHQYFAERFLSHSLSEDIEYPDPSATFDLYVERDLHPSEILDIIEFSDPRFESLTGHSNWPTYHEVA